MGCSCCHVTGMTINYDRRVADLETIYDRVQGIFNACFRRRPRFTGRWTTVRARRT
jgi:hypothetical protein